MKPALFFLALGVLGLARLVAAAEPLPIEQRVAEAVSGPKTTVLHFWAPWCPNCSAELAGNKWSEFITRNREVNFIFVTVWSAGQGDGRALLEKNGVGPQQNFQLLLHPNEFIGAEKKTSQFLGLPLTWIPATWVFRDGKLRYALNYGELRFPILQQLLDDTADNWDR
jgi:thiol-disulfide isomerase/thioredoxin